MVVPSPECGIVDLELHVPANASAGRLGSGKFAGRSPARGPLHVEPRSEKVALKSFWRPDPMGLSQAHQSAKQLHTLVVRPFGRQRGLAVIDR